MGFDFKTEKDIQRIIRATIRTERLLAGGGNTSRPRQVAANEPGIGKLLATLQPGTPTSPADCLTAIWAYDDDTETYVDTGEQLTIYDIGLVPIGGLSGGTLVYYTFRNGLPLFDGAPCA